MPPNRHVLVTLLVFALGSLPLGCRKAPAPPGGPASSGDQPAGPADSVRTAPAPSDSDAPIMGDAHRPSPAAADQGQSPRTPLLDSLSAEARQAFLAGERALAEGDYGSAADELTRAAQFHPDNAQLLRALCEALTAAERYDRAVDAYKQLLALDERDLVTTYNLAVAYTRLGDYHLAERTYRKLLRADEQHLPARFNLAAVYRHQGKLDDARRTWRAYLRQDDSNAEVHALLGEVLLQLQQPQDALDHLRKASVLAPDDLVTQRQLAVAAKLTDNYGWAATALERAAALAPTDAAIWADLGGVLLTIHRDTSDTQFLRQAIAAWEQSLEIDPDQPELREYLATYRND